jgi:hypothetical protein
MSQVTEFDLAEKRFKERQRNQVLFVFWLVLFCVTITVNVIWGGIAGFWILLEVFTGIAAVAKLVQLYNTSPRHPPKTQSVEQEMNWLFGDDWQQFTGTQEYAFAQDRIRKRGLQRWGFLLHLLFFVPIGAFSLYSISFLESYGQPGGLFCLAAPIVWLIVFVIPHAIQVFPTKGMLASREQKAGAALLLELQTLRPEKLKHEEKPKHDTQYILGDDGEIMPATDNRQKRSSEFE